ncbi:MAG TPA: DUF1573 domain-containing protein [Deltaproteobacteria bacterium]|nr:DUF1573 domain-containing protein [Deltaproteobacteria bacterium]
MASFTRQIPPGGEGKISVKLRTKGYGGRSLSKTIKVYTNDKKNPVSTVSIKGKVKKFAIISPSRVRLRGEVGDEVKVTVKVSPATRGLFEIVKAKAAKGKDMAISLKEEDKPDGKSWILTVENRRKAKGRYHDTIRLLTTSRVIKELTIPVYGNITPRQIASISPPGTLILRGTAGEPAKLEATIVPRKDQMFDIVEARATKGENIRLTLAATDRGDKKVYTLTVENTQETQGRFTDTIRLLTTHDTQKELIIPVVGQIRAPQIASIKPRRLVLTGRAGETIKGSVKIIPTGKYPFSITGVKPRDGKNIKCGIREAQESEKKIYILTVENLKKEKGRYYDTISLKTDCKYQPEIRVGLTARIDE